MKPKRFAPPHMVRLYPEDEKMLMNMPGKNPSEKIRELVKECFKLRDDYRKLLEAKQVDEEMYNPSDLSEPWI